LIKLADFVIPRDVKEYQYWHTPVSKYIKNGKIN
jgi:hypothetical protein